MLVVLTCILSLVAPQNIPQTRNGNDVPDDLESVFVDVRPTP